MEWNKKSFVLENGSRVIAAATSSSAIRGMSVNYLMIDEAAFLDNVWDEFFASVYPTISSGKNTRLVLVSTPNGMNHYYKLWMDAIAGRNMFHPFKVTWRDVPGRDEKWKEETVANTSYEQFLQEHECEFLGSSNTLISSGVLKNLVAEEPKEIIDNLRIYEYPVGNKDEQDVDVFDDDPFDFSIPEKENESTQKNHVYVIVVDTSHGKGLDYSAFSVIDITEYPFKQVAAFYDQNISPLVYPHIIISTAKKYNNAHILVETNDIGRSIVESINLDLGYENIIMSTTATNNENSKAEFGVRTTKKVKSIGCSVMKDLIESGRLIVKDQETINELCSFVIKGKSYEAQKGCHDDLVMTLVLFSWFTTDPYFEEIQQTQGIKEVFFNEAREFEELLNAVAEVNELDDFDGFLEEGGENWQPL
ncbi:MAG: terminase [Methanobacteriota archaeon]|nr:MAG: terminase [Euryarchaeota archaeon]